MIKIDVFKADVNTEHNLNVFNISPENLWHRRLGHLNRIGMKILNLPVSNEKCSTCIEGKATRKAV